LSVVVYGFCASVLPVWLFLAPRDYLSTFVKLGVVVALAIGILFVRPELQLPAFTRFVDGSGPVFAGKIFPFCFITIACGAVSGFHSLISSGTTPKLIAKESHIFPIGYGAMLMESFVAVMAMIAACVLQPGVYFAVNSPAGVVGATPAVAAATISGWGFPVTAVDMATLARNVGEQTLFYRTGGAPSLALGMAAIFARGGGGQAVLGFWYHFAIMFEALFILTIIAAGTRVGRFMLTDLLVHMKVGPAKPNRSGPAWVIGTTLVIIAAWGYFLVQGVRDPLGGINSLWPLFGISNQLLAALALCVATTILLKMHGPKFMWITCVPLAWLAAATFTASYQKIFSPLPALGFLAQARQLELGPQSPTTQELIFNARLDAAVCGLLAVLVAVILLDSLRVWYGLLRGTRDTRISEAPFVHSRLQPEEI
jgi:carbon starvation protein